MLDLLNQMNEDSKKVWDFIAKNNIEVENWPKCMRNSWKNEGEIMDEAKKVGRPRKEVEVVENPQVNYTHNALGLFQGTDNQWYVASLRFDPVTGSATVSDRTLAGEDKNFANELFKLKAVELDMV